MNILPVVSAFRRPTFHYTKTFRNGATVHVQIKPGVIKTMELEIEVSTAKPKFEPGKQMDEYEKWRDDCIRNAAKHIRRLPGVLRQPGAFA